MSGLRDRRLAVALGDSPDLPRGAASRCAILRVDDDVWRDGVETSVCGSREGVPMERVVESRSGAFVDARRVWNDTKRFLTSGSIETSRSF